MMSNERFQQIVSGMTEQAMRIFDAVPKEEYWTAHQVTGELTRLNIQMAPNAVSGCLDSLVRAGIIKENNRKFIRIKVRKAAARKSLADLIDLAQDLADTVTARATTTQPEEPIMNAPHTAAMKIITPETLGLPKKKQSLSDLIGDLAQQLQATSQRHREEMATLADLVADLAIDVQAEAERHATETQKYAQLKLLLKDF